MSEPAYKVRWKGVESGPFTVEQIEQMVECRQLSGASQVNTSAGWVLLQDFIHQVGEHRESERLREQKQAARDAVSRERELEEAQAANERLRVRLKKEEQLRTEEDARIREENERLGKKYYAMFDGLKKGPLTKDQMLVYLNGGKLDPNSLVWTEELGDWHPLHCFPELAIAFQAQMNVWNEIPGQAPSFQPSGQNVLGPGNAGFNAYPAFAAMGFWQRRQMLEQMEDMNESLDELSGDSGDFGGGGGGDGGGDGGGFDFGGCF